MKRIVAKGFLVLLWLITSTLNAQVLRKGSYRFDNPPAKGLSGNGITDILISEDTVWVATGDGLSKTSNEGQAWVSYFQQHGLGKSGISAMAANDTVIWVATSYDTTVGVAGAGGGLSYSTDRGATWVHFPQPQDARTDNKEVYASGDTLDALPITTHIDNITYDIAFTKDGTIWITSFAGGLRKSADNGQTWQRVILPPDNLDRIDPSGSYNFDLSPIDRNDLGLIGNLNHRTFSVISVDDSILWVGTAGGINKSTDGGISWEKFNHQNQAKPISGNFVVAIGHQRYNGKDIIWAATIEAEDPDEFRAVSKTENDGQTWTTTLEGEFAHNFAFDDSIVYAVTDNGLFKSEDGGETWFLFPQIVDNLSGEAVYTTEFYSAAVSDRHVLWAGSADGLARTPDNGNTWQIFRSFVPTGQEGTPRTYAYPNPFSPLRHNRIGGDGHVRFQYRTTKATRITIKIYDFGMNLVKTVVQGKSRPEGDFSEVWDGRNEKGDVVANGVYFYKLEMEGDKPCWGKIIVLD